MPSRTFRPSLCNIFLLILFFIYYNESIALSIQSLHIPCLVPHASRSYSLSACVAQIWQLVYYIKCQQLILTHYYLYIKSLLFFLVLMFIMSNSKVVHIVRVVFFHDLIFLLVLLVVGSDHPHVDLGHDCRCWFFFHHPCQYLFQSAWRLV